MSDSEQAYATVVKAVQGRWRRRLLAMAHLFAFFTAYLMIWERTAWYARSLQTVWFVVLGLHLMWALMAELRDRSIRREVEHERKWRLIEHLEDIDPYTRERILRLAEAPDGELIDFDAAAWTENVKRKRG
ncbi:MAG: hypothetical protein KC547_19620 [Anaerolineae bacterium]|nr:hypothetical protein [Anaerolineae bacterium]